MTHLPKTLLLLLALFAARDAAAQPLAGLPLSLEVRLGAGFPTGDLAEDDPGIGAEAGPAFSAGARFHVTAGLAVYGAYSRTAFLCDACREGGIDDEVVDAGGEFGVQASLPGRIAGVAPWIRAGGVYRQLTFAGDGGRLSSDAAAGWEAGAGLSVPLGRSLSISPGIRYRAYAAELDLGAAAGTTVDVSYLLADVGLAFRF